MAEDVNPTVEQLLADERRRPREGWSAVAEDWSDQRDLATWRYVELGAKLRRRLAAAETDAELLYAALEGERARVRELEKRLSERRAA